ncbi:MULTISPECIES: hypothetical protein [Bradyrhizobium]|uniref:hypothetical protein n=1 Tax=Bradyrhizobium elkanii TaxID=29448 RepID=UPI0012BD0502|nr:hypothetical protein [Bradyrhizobium elkanii]
MATNKFNKLNYLNVKLVFIDIMRFGQDARCRRIFCPCNDDDCRARECLWRSRSHDHWRGDHHGHVNGAAGPIAGAGLPMLAIGYGVYWLIKRRGKHD